MGGRTFVLDKRAEGKLAIGYAKQLVKLKYWTEIPQEFVHKSLPKGALENAEKLVRFGHYDQLLKASSEADAAFRKMRTTLGENTGELHASLSQDDFTARLKEYGDFQGRVSGHMSSAITLIDEMFQNYKQLGIKDDGNLAKLKSKFGTLKNEAKERAFEYDKALYNDYKTVPQHGEKLWKVTTDAIIAYDPEMVESLWDVVFCMKRMARNSTPDIQDEFDSLRDLYDSFVEHTISALIEQAVRKVSE